MLLLHLDDILTEVIFPSDLVTLRKVINLLILVESLIEVALASGVAP